MPAAPGNDDADDFDPEMTAADYLSLGLAWVADMIAQSSYPPPPEVIGQSSYQPPPEVPYWGTPVQHTEPFAHMSAETPPTAYAPRRQTPSKSSSGEHQIRAQVDRGLGRGHRETRQPPCGTRGCLDPVVGRRGRGRGTR
ncbi:hypothetical protein PIB30_043814 [Stylosanthes scabra]|uniref:Uncharacterized protein n=1 Tax=Stylosanthes scabra TaxID=79078 RepID=A0ABU6UEY4_9FABA|nr:hypothetical protein [Stylosanthes scabra]